MQGIPPEDILVEYESSHKKNWDNDILGYEKREKKLICKLSRDGLFHSLPENLFLKPLEGGRDSIDEIHSFNRSQKKRAEILFNPLENGIFQERVALELHENELLSLLNISSFGELKKFWMISDMLPDIFQSRLQRVIPYLHSVVGNFPLTAKYLSYFLEEAVAWKIENRCIPVKVTIHSSAESLGSFSCGDNMIVGGEIIEESPALVYTIGPIRASQIDHFLESGYKRKFIDTFTEYFIPIGYDMDIIIDILDEDMDFSLSESFLGFNTVSLEPPASPSRLPDSMFTLDQLILDANYISN